MHVDDLFHAHPYHPTSLELKGFVPQQLPFEQTLAVFFASTFVVLFAGWRMTGACASRSGRASAVTAHVHDLKMLRGPGLRGRSGVDSCPLRVQVGWHMQAGWAHPWCKPLAPSSQAHDASPGVRAIAGNYKHLVTKERLLVCWFLCTGLIHFIVEGEAPEARAAQLMGRRSSCSGEHAP